MTGTTRAGPQPRERPFFVVGCPRSGTTLVREILDNHPRLAVVDESHLVVGLAPRWWTMRRQPTVDDVLSHPRVQRWDVPRSDLIDQIDGRDGGEYPDPVRQVFDAYARCRRTPRWGDKTPGYVTYVRRLARWFPDAQFIHVVRDGREVAASLAERAWGPPSAVSGAFWWAWKVRTGRRQGRALGAHRYVEVRLEDLVENPEATIRAVCEFLGEPFTPSMLDYHLRFAHRNPVPRDQERHLVRPPTAQLRDWRHGLPSHHATAVETICHGQLRAFGYEPDGRSIVGALVGATVRLRDLLRTAPRSVMVRLRPWRREF